MWRESPDPGSPDGHTRRASRRKYRFMFGVRRRFDGIPCRRAQTFPCGSKSNDHVDVHRIDFRRRLDMDAAVERLVRVDRAEIRSCGLAVTSHAAGTTNTATLDNVGRRRIADAESAALALAQADVGNVGVAGSGELGRQHVHVSAARAPTSGNRRCVSLRVRVDRSRHDDPGARREHRHTNAFAKPD